MKIHAHEWVLGVLLLGLLWFLLASSSTGVARAEKPTAARQPAPPATCERCGHAVHELDV